MIYQIAIILCCMLFGNVNSQKKSQPSVCMPIGCVYGKEMPGYPPEPYEAFLGIPYAQSPEWNLRFKPPQPIKPWKGYRTVTSDEPECLQKNYMLPGHPITGSEDCLYLNIYRPKGFFVNLPVMVYIHGGGFFFGSASPNIHGPEYFMHSKEVILVTIAYRLGPFGFLSTCDESIYGNMGLKDQNMALKFVKDNIKAFGGDPNLITIFGQSAGGVSVHLHMLSPLSRGLFHRAIPMSGLAPAPFADVIKDPLEQVNIIAQFCNVTASDRRNPAVMAEKLKWKDANAILEATNLFKTWDIDPLTIYRPVIEFPHEGAFLTSEPKYLIATGQYHKVPWMTGFVPNEGSIRGLSILLNPMLRDSFNEDFEKRFFDIMELPEFSQTWANKQAILNYYFGDERQLVNKTYQGFIDSITDRAFMHPLIRTIQQYVRTSDPSTAPVYLYKYAYRSYFSYSMFASGTLLDYGVSHCDDLVSLFRSFFFRDPPTDSADYRVIREMVSIYTTFAKTGKPPGKFYMRPCDDRIFSRDGEICDYWEIKNQGTSYFAGLMNYFNMKPVELWDSVIDLFDWCFY